MLMNISSIKDLRHKNKKKIYIYIYIYIIKIHCILDM